MSVKQNGAPRLSIIVPEVSDHGALAGLVRSLACADRGTFECIVVGSVTGTRSALQALAEADICGRSLIVEISDPLAVRLNRALDVARGDYVLVLGSDERLGEAFVTTAVSLMDADGRLGIVYGDVRLFGAVNALLPSAEFDRRRMTHADLIPSHTVWRRECWSRSRGPSPGTRALRRVVFLPRRSAIRICRATSSGTRPLAAHRPGPERGTHGGRCAREGGNRRAPSSDFRADRNRVVRGAPRPRANRRRRRPSGSHSDVAVRGVREGRRGANRRRLGKARNSSRTRSRSSIANSLWR